MFYNDSSIIELKRMVEALDKRVCDLERKNQIRGFNSEPNGVNRYWSAEIKDVIFAIIEKMGASMYFTWPSGGGVMLIDNNKKEE